MSQKLGYWAPALPKIGIRPTIDGRRNGIRESLEDVVMDQAKAAAKYLTANLLSASSPTLASAAWSRPLRPARSFAGKTSVCR